MDNITRIELTSRENVKLLAGDLVEGRHFDSEVLGEDLLRDVREPIGELGAE